MGIWSDPAGAAPFPAARRGFARVEALDRIADWTRTRFGLAREDTVIVREARPTLPGFPPRETHVAFWTADGTPHRFRVFKPVEGVGEGDIPPAWLRESLTAVSFDCDCC